MPSYGQSVALQFYAWDAYNSVGKTGDAANFTLKWVKDGVASAPTNTATEITGGGGVYKITLTATECQCQTGTICGTSSTNNVVIVPTTVSFENLPTATPATTGGIPTVDANNCVKIQLTQLLDSTNTGDSVGGALLAGRSQGFGKWVLAAGVLTMYAADNTTVVRQFTILPAPSDASRS